jgi:chorismate synthase
MLARINVDYGANKQGVNMLRYLTAGESHGAGLVAILEGMPAGLKVAAGDIDKELKRRQHGFGRGKRMQIEKDRVAILSGLKSGKSLGSPIALLIKNKDFSIEKLHKVMCPRPGHADLAGLLKYGFTDVREVLERASARSTAALVAVGAIGKVFLREFGVHITSQVLSIGGADTTAAMHEKVRAAVDCKDTLGGIFQVCAHGVPAGLGSYVQPDKRLDGRLAQAFVSIPGVKSFEIGLGSGYAVKFGSEVHDEIFYSKPKGFYHTTNNSGGIEGGISNGEDIVIRSCMKPIATLMRPLSSVDILTKRPARAAVERSDVCVVESAGVVAEAALAFELSRAMLEKFGGDNLLDIKKSYAHYRQRTRQ